MKLIIEKITPKIAAEYLTKVPQSKQRRLMPRVVAAYASTMRAGAWTLTHQGIAFDDQEALIDGQHRLGAIVESGCTVELPVYYDLPSKGDQVLNAIDSGRARRVGDHLTMQYGYRSNGNIMAAATRTIQSICLPTKLAHTVNIALKIIDIYGEELNYCWRSISEMRSLKSGTVMGACAFVSKGMSKAKFKDFYAGLMTGENLSEGDPTLTLRNHLLEQAAGRSGGTALLSRVSALVCLAGYHYQSGTTIKALRYSKLGIDFFIDKQMAEYVAVRKAIGVKKEELEARPNAEKEEE